MSRKKGTFVRNVLNYCPSCIEDGKDSVGKPELTSLSNYLLLGLRYGCRVEEPKGNPENSRPEAFRQTILKWANLC